MLSRCFWDHARPKTDVEVALLLPAYGTILGCLLGAIPEGLDWEESWQVRIPSRCYC